MAFGKPFKVNIDNKCDMDNKTYSPTQSVHSLSDMDDNHNLSSFTCHPSPQDKRDLKQVATSILP